MQEKRSMRFGKWLLKAIVSYAVFIAAGLLLAKLTVVVEDPQAVAAYADILKSELNVKDVEFCTLEDAGSVRRLPRRHHDQRNPH